MMKRLEDRQSVWLCAAHRDGPARQCSVVAVYRSFVALCPLSEPLADRGGTPTEYYLVFDFEGRPVALRGRLESRGEHDVRFYATDGVLLSQRAAPRLDAELPVELISADRPEAPPFTATTVRYSADGALLDDGGAFAAGEQVMFTFAPADGLRMTGRGQVLHLDEERPVVVFHDVDATLRNAVVEHVIAAKRRSVLPA
jgi:hypothetical protein